MSIRIRIATGLALAATLCGAPFASAQTAGGSGPLSTFVTNPTNGATPLQQSFGDAIQRTCVDLTGRGGLQLPAGGARDLFLRCNEIVRAASLLNGVTPPTGDRAFTNDRTTLLASIQQLAGEELSVQGSLTNRVTAGQLSNISGRLNAVRLGSGVAASRGRVAQLPQRSGSERGGAPLEREAWSALAFAPRGTAPSAEYDFFAALAPQTGAAAGGAGSGLSASPWGWFVEGSYSTGDRDPELNTDGFDFDASSVTIGVDYNFGNGVVGASVGYDKYDADFDTVVAVAGGNAKVDGTSGSIFGAWFGGRVSINGVLSFGKLDTDVLRFARYTGNIACPVNPPDLTCGSNATLAGSPDGDYFAGGITVGTDIEAGGWSVAPSLSLAVRNVDSDAYSETALSAGPGFGLGLSYESRKFESTRAIAGVIASRSLSRSFGVLTPSLRLEWHHEFEDDPVDLNARFVNANAACTNCGILIPGGEVDTDFGVVGLALSATFSRRLQGYVQYETLLGQSGLTTHSIALGLRGQF